MTTTLTISAPLAMAAVPGLIAIGGVVVGIALNGWLTTGIEVARLNAANDDKTARWLFLRGYRKTPHAGPDITAEPAPLALSDRSHADEQADHTDTDRAGMWRVLLGLAKDNFDGMARGVAEAIGWLARGVGYSIEWAAYLLKSDKQREAEFIDSYQLALEQARDEVPTELGAELEVPVELPTRVDLDPDDKALLELEAWKAANPPTNRTPYVGRHWVSDIEHTGAWPLVVPQQRSGDADV